MSDRLRRTPAATATAVAPATSSMVSAGTAARTSTAPWPTGNHQNSAEGYALRIDRAGGRLGSVALGGSDAAGQ